jgi:hypothetical protein
MMKGNYKLDKGENVWSLESEFQCMIDKPHVVEEYMKKVEKSGQTLDRYQQEFECGIDREWQLYNHYDYFGFIGGV